MRFALLDSEASIGPVTGVPVSLRIGVGVDGSSAGCNQINLIQKVKTRGNCHRRSAHVTRDPGLGLGPGQYLAFVMIALFWNKNLSTIKRCFPVVRLAAHLCRK